MGPKALLLLAIHFWKHVLKKVTFTYRAGGSERFISNYLPDRLLPLSPETRRALPSWQRCTACGLCDSVYDRAGVSLMGLVVSASRDFSEMQAAAPDAAYFDDTELLAAAEAACPEQVPIADVVAYLADTPNRLNGALQR